jgi:hypothetical protein
MKRPKRICLLCQTTVAVLKDGGLHAHLCQHGLRCYSGSCRKCVGNASESVLVMDLAFAIDDPCGSDAIDLARALVRLGKTIPERHRRTFLSLCNTWIDSFKDSEASG